MKKRVLSFVVLILVAVCGGIFVACGGELASNVSISVSDGLDSQSGLLTNQIAEELKLSQAELENLSAGVGFNNSVSSGRAVSVVVSSEANATRVITVKINGFSSNMGREVYFSTDSDCISISDVEYFGDGEARVTITAVSAGTAEVFVRTGQFSKTTSFTVKSIEKLSSFSVKHNAVIYLERGKTLSINPENYLNFYPLSSNLREVEFYDGDRLLTFDGKTVLATEELFGATGVVSNSKEISIRSLRLSGSNSVQTISVVVVDSLSNLNSKKVVYAPNGEKSYVGLENNSILTVIRNISAGEINYGIRELFVVVECNEENLEIFSKISSEAEELSLVLTPAYIERITHENFSEAQYSNLIDTTRETFSTWVFKFEFKYEGYNFYDVEFGFKRGNYIYKETISQQIQFKSASNLVEFKLSNETAERENNTYSVYDYYFGLIGTKFVISTNISDEFSKANLSLVLDSTADSAFEVLDLSGTQKQLFPVGEYVVCNFLSGENFYIKANENKVGSYSITARVSYTFEGIDFITEKTIHINVVNSPTDFTFNKENGEEITSYVFDLNTSGQIISGINKTQAYSVRNSLNLFLNGIVGSGASTGALNEFVVVNNSNFLRIEKSSNAQNEIIITALSEGSGTFRIISGNGISKTFSYTIIKSVSQANAFLPSAEQNDNIIAVLNNYLHESKTYDQYAIIKTNSQIPLVLNINGTTSLVSAAGNNISYKSGRISASAEFNKQVLTVSITYNYVEDNLIKSKIVVIKEILLTSIVQLENFSISTSKNSNNFELFSFSSVGYYSKSLASVNVYLNVVPQEIKNEIFKTVSWSSNLNYTIEEKESNKTVVLKTDAFTFTFYREGPNAGTGELVCDVTNSELFDENGNFSLGKVVLTASVSRTEGGNFAKNIQFKVKRATNVELIGASKSSIELDAFTPAVELGITVFPIDATNLNLNYIFIPKNQGLNASVIEINRTENGIRVVLKDTTAYGEGTLRIVAMDSYSSLDNFNIYLDIPVVISNGGELYPYYINFASDVDKMIQTNFEQYYVVSGEIDLSSVQWEVGKYSLKGTIIGKNNAKFTNILINSAYFNDAEKEYYAALFSEITGQIENVAFEVSFNLDLTQNTLKTNAYNGFIGSVAGKNFGSIIDTSVSISGGKIIFKDTYDINFGGLVGNNSGLISNLIDLNSVNVLLVDFTEKLDIQDATEGTNNYGHVLNVGGVVGLNSGGSVTRIIAEGLSEYNNGFATAKINITISYSENPTISGSVEAIGGIVGKNLFASSSVSNQGLSNVSAVGTISADNFNNVGGIAGENEAKIEWALAQVYVSGNNAIGGAVGTNSGNLSSIIVENIDTGKSDSALIKGNSEVGGIVGNMKGGTLTYSSFISYLFENEDKDLNSKGSYGLIVGTQTEGTSSVDYVVAIANGTRTVESTLFADNYAIFDRTSSTARLAKGAGISTMEEGEQINKTREELKETDGFGFIFLPSDEIALELTDKDNGNGIEQIMNSSENDNLAFYMFYYDSGSEKVKTLNLNEILISKLLTSSIGNRFTISSSDTRILEIVNGKFVVNGTGTVVLTISSPYVANTNQKIYVKIVNYTNNISIYLDLNKKQEINSESKIIFDASENKLIYFDFLDKFNIDGFKIPTDIKVLIEIIKKGEDGETEIIVATIKPGETKLENTSFSLIEIGPDSYQVAVYGETGEYSVKILPYVELVGEDGKVYTSVLLENKDKVGIADGAERNLNLKSSVLSEFEFKNTTKSIEVSKSAITTEPYYVVGVDVTLNSINESETIKFLISQIDENGNEIELNTALELEVIYNNKTLTKNLSEGFNMNCKENPSFKLYFKINEEGRVFENKQIFIITVSSSNGKSATLNLTYQPQSLISISSTLYPLSSQDEDKYGFEGSFSYIPSGVLIPGQNSLIEFSITPNFTYFDTIEIINAESNQYNLVFDLFNRTQDSVVTGSKALHNGISIKKDLIKSGFFSLRTFADQRTSDNSYVTIIILLKDSNGNQIGKAIEKTFYIEHLPGVVVTVDGVSSGNSEDMPLKLAQGVSYDMDVWVKGYSFGNFASSTGLFTDGEVVFELSGNSNLISIVKNSDGTFKLVVNSSELITSRTVQINSYGINSNGERSKEVVLYIEIVQFVVKSQNIGDIITDVSDNVYASAIGNSYTLEISLNSDILIYDKSNETIRASVLAFLQSLSTGVVDNKKANVWFYREPSAEVSDWKTIVGNSAFGQGVGLNNFVWTSSYGTFRITYNEASQKVVIKFLKTESPAAPTMQIKFEARFIYNEFGVPKLLIGTSVDNIYTLSQTISFDISEKTNLRNPFPISNYEQLMDMREGNYYILMNDITLPVDFTPIQTLIGGLDGNNHRIIIPSISLRATEENQNLLFGLFERTSETALLKNIILYINGNVDISTYYYSSVYYGLLVAENNGQITNCAIEGSNYAIINLNLFGTSSATTIINEVGGLVGINYGDITNSRIEAGISINSVREASVGYMPANLGGIASINRDNGTIASCYVKARIENNTAGSVSAITGGVVGQNFLGGRIFATYISGEKTLETETSEYENVINIVYSTASASAFVYENNGEISNCFANIPVITNEGASGFVYRNQTSGNINYCYSTSALSNSAKNGTFIGIITGVAQDESPILNLGTLSECFAWEEDGQLANITNSGLGSNQGDNTNGLRILNKTEFREKENFAKYAFSNTANKTDGVWFWASTNGESDFIREGYNLKFSTLVPQLVSPNIIVGGHQTLEEIRFDPETQTSLYIYAEDENHPEGSKYNPYIIANENDLEFLVSKQSGFTNGTIIKEVYCRLIGDVIYETSTVSSGLFQYSFLGNLEGNSYTIGNYVLDSSAKMDNGGFFATIGTATNQTGSVKNLTFAPRYMSLTNCNAVGAVAGTIYGGTLVNININGGTYAVEIGGVTILGKNAVGGVVGVAEGEFNFNNITSNISVNSSYRASLNGHLVKEYLSAPINQISYSGLIAGITNGYGKITYAYVFGNNVSVAENASLMFGYVGKNIIASNLTATGAINQSIKADVYGGVIAGHNLGSLTNISVIGDISSGYNGFFAFDKYTPIAIGNIVGYMTNGKISNANITTKLRAQSGVVSLGGAVGYMSAGELENIIINGDIVGGSRIGGIIGQVRNDSNNYKIVITDCFHSGVITSNSSSDFVSVGTIIGFVSNFEAGLISSNSEESISPKINIIFNNDFKSEIEALLESGIYVSKVNITTYSTSPTTQIFVGIATTENKTTLQKGLYESQLLSTYVIDVLSSNQFSLYVPLTQNYNLNGVLYN